MHLVIRADFKEFGLELIALADIDRDYVVREPSSSNAIVTLCAFGVGQKYTSIISNSFHVGMLPISC
jgi:hypothetical protein